MGQVKAAFKFQHDGVAYCATSEDLDMAERLSPALENEASITHLEDLDGARFQYGLMHGFQMYGRVISIDETFDIEMTPREMFRAIDVMLYGLTVGEEIGQ